MNNLVVTDIHVCTSKGEGSEVFSAHSFSFNTPHLHLTLKIAINLSWLSFNIYPAMCERGLMKQSKKCEQTVLCASGFIQTVLSIAKGIKVESNETLDFFGTAITALPFLLGLKSLVGINSPPKPTRAPLFRDGCSVTMVTGRK